MWLFSQEIQIGSKGNLICLCFLEKRGKEDAAVRPGGLPRCPVKYVVQWKEKVGCRAGNVVPEVVDCEEMCKESMQKPLTVV